MVLSKLSATVFRHPIFISACQTGTLMSAGDLISQNLVEKKDKVDFTRTARFGLLGLCFVGPTLRVWYGVLEKYVKLKSPALTAFGKMGVDQGFFAPFFLFNFIGVVGLTQNHSLEQIKQKISHEYVDIMIANYKLWPAVQIINFFYVPLAHRVLFAQTIALFWNTYLAWKTNQPEISKVQEKSSIGN